MNRLNVHVVDRAQVPVKKGTKVRCSFPKAFGRQHLDGKTDQDGHAVFDKLPATDDLQIIVEGKVRTSIKIGINDKLDITVTV